MSVADFDRIHYLRTDLKALLHKNTLHLTPALAAMAALNWLVSVAIIFPPAAITIANKEFSIDIQKQVPTFNSFPLDNGSYMDAQDNVFFKSWAWHPG
jgi:hypothetical protein